MKGCFKVDSLVFESTLKNSLAPLGLYSAVTYNANPFKLILKPPDFDLVPRENRNTLFFRTQREKGISNTMHNFLSDLHITVSNYHQSL